MGQIRAKDTKAEIALRKELFKRGFRFRKNDPRLPGKPDIVLPRYRVCVFVDGDFWHGREWRRRGYPSLAAAFKQNGEFWVKKIQNTVARDRRQDQELRALGWQVVRIWESDICRSLIRVADCLERLVLKSGAPER
jgi:DNA mismatch endonuclease (patch repair protein)